MLVSPLVELPRILASDRLKGPRARWLAMVGVTRIRLYRGTAMLAASMGSGAAQAPARWNRS